MTVADALATLERIVREHRGRTDGRVALHCVEAEIARLEDAYAAIEAAEASVRKHERHIDTLLERAEAAEAEAHRLKDGLRRIAETCDGVVERIAEVGEPPHHWSGTQIDAERMRDFARALLAEDGAAHDDRPLITDDDWHLRFEDALSDRDRLKQRAAALEDGLRAFSAVLHVPPDGIGPEGITAHRHMPGHPMGCPVCKALDEALAEDGAA